MYPKGTRGAVSGANQGLGFALVEALCRSLGPEASVYLTARNRVRGEEAVRKLRAKALSPLFHLLDVNNEQTLEALAETIQKRHGGIDILISNAAARISPNFSQAEQVASFVETNNHGTYRMIRTFGPMLKDHARFLIVASGFGSLHNMPSATRNSSGGAWPTSPELCRRTTYHLRTSPS